MAQTTPTPTAADRKLLADELQLAANDEARPNPRRGLQDAANLVRRGASAGPRMDAALRAIARARMGDA